MANRIIGEELEDIIWKRVDIERIIFRKEENDIYCEIEVDTPIEWDKFEELIKKMQKDGWKFMASDISEEGIPKPKLLISFVKKEGDGGIENGN